MEFFKKIKECFKIRKSLKSSLNDMKEKEERSLNYSTEELTTLSDTDLFWAVTYRTEHQVDSYDKWEDGVNSLNASQKIFYSINWLETEVNNGGLCQFFVNSSRIVAPLVSGYMEIIGALDHKKLYDDFVEKNGIDVTDLSFFDMDDASEFEEKNESYPFDEFDSAFFELEPLETYLTLFAKAHLTDF